MEEMCHKMTYMSIEAVHATAKDRPMTTPITVLAPFRLASGRTEADLLAASDTLERDFVSNQPGILSRDLVLKEDGRYMDIVRFRSREDMEQVMEAERTSPVCHDFFAVMDMSEGDEAVEVCASLANYVRG
jgi:hypothetical protein